MTEPITQEQFLTYMQYFKDIESIEQCSRNNNLSQIIYYGKRFQIIDSGPIGKQFANIFERFSKKELKKIEKRITFINDIHHRIENANLNDGKPDNYSAVAAGLYNVNLRTITLWNKCYAQSCYHIEAPNYKYVELNPSFTDKTSEQQAEEKAQNDYLVLITRYPHITRSGDLNDHTKGAIEVIYVPEKIKEAQKEFYQKLCSKYQQQGKSPEEAHALAKDLTKWGVRYEDQFVVLVREYVISVTGDKHTYIRVIWKSHLNGIGGAATLPILATPDGKKIVLQLEFRHQTGYELGICRGVSKPNETAHDTSRREMKEETGYEVKAEKIVPLGSITPDNGILTSIISLFMGEVSTEDDKGTKHDKYEAIKGKYAFTPQEVAKGIIEGYMKIEIDGVKTDVPLRCPFLNSALLIAILKGELDLPR